MIKPDSFVLIQGWMLTDFKLKGLDLMIFAIVYSYSQAISPNGSQVGFNGSISFLMKWTNASDFGVRKSLKRLVDLGYIRKEVYFDKNVRRVQYFYNSLLKGE